MSDSGRRIGECLHGNDKNTCQDCIVSLLQFKLETARKLADHWQARHEEAIESRSVWTKKAHELEKYNQELFAEKERLADLLQRVEALYITDFVRAEDPSDSYEIRLSRWRKRLELILNSFHAEKTEDPCASE